MVWLDWVVGGGWREGGTPDFVDKSVDLFFHVYSTRAMRESLVGQRCLGALFVTQSHPAVGPGLLGPTRFCWHRRLGTMEIMGAVILRILAR